MAGIEISRLLWNLHHPVLVEEGKKEAVKELLRAFMDTDSHIVILCEPERGTFPVEVLIPVNTKAAADVSHMRQHLEETPLGIVYYVRMHF